MTIGANALCSKMQDGEKYVAAVTARLKSSRGQLVKSQHAKNRFVVKG
jgi:hypothetical protein